MARTKCFPFDEMVSILRQAVGDDPPIVTSMGSKPNRDPFLILVGTLLSLRTKDETTEKVMEHLAKVMKGPEDILRMSTEDLRTLIFPTGFYRNKADTLKDISRTIVEDLGGKIPDDLDALLKLRGVGRKTANLVLTEAFGKPGICVDTHVHRISNRLGAVSTRNPFQTEEALRQNLPGKHWMAYNGLLVSFGKRICTPLSPRCSLCPLAHLCARVGVVKHR